MKKKKKNNSEKLAFINVAVFIIVITLSIDLYLMAILSNKTEGRCQDET